MCVLMACDELACVGMWVRSVTRTACWRKASRASRMEEVQWSGAVARAHAPPRRIAPFDRTSVRALTPAAAPAVTVALPLAMLCRGACHSIRLSSINTSLHGDSVPHAPCPHMSPIHTHHGTCGSHARIMRGSCVQTHFGQNFLFSSLTTVGQKFLSLRFEPSFARSY